MPKVWVDRFNHGNLILRCTYVVFSAFVAALLVTGCLTPVTLKEVQQDAVFRKMQSNAITEDVMSPHTAQVLRVYNMTTEFAADPDQTMRDLRERACSDPDRYLLFSMAELSYLVARGYEDKSAEDALGYFISSARFAYAFLFDDNLGAPPNQFDPRFRLGCELYNHSLARALRLLEGISTAEESDGSVRIDTWDGPLRVRVEMYGFPDEHPSFADLLLSADYEVEGINNHYRSYGLGIPMIGLLEQDADNPNQPPRASYPATAILRFNRLACVDYDQTLDATLELYDPLHINEVDIDGTRSPLESDVTTPLAYALSDPNLRTDAFLGFLRAERADNRTGLFMIDPYESDKIPVVLTHGLVSSPLTWADMLNDLRGDPVLRERYQFWLFQYPTGYPFIYSASVFRKALEDARKRYDPSGDSVAFNNMVLIGHSMGGLLSKLQVQDSGDALWESFSSRPFDELNLSEKDRDLLRSVFFYQSAPYVKRVVFICTPHRGSTLSDRALGSAIARLVAVPKFLLNTTFDVMTLNIDTAGDKITKRDFTSVKNLSPNNRFIQATEVMPIHDGVHYHTIFGNIRKGDEKDGSDGVVAYTSSHLDGAESAYGVSCGHSAHCHPLGILEVRRILTEHLKLVDGR